MRGSPRAIVVDGWAEPAVIGGRQPLKGRRPGDVRIRVDRPHTPYFRYTGPGTLVAKPAAIAPKTRMGRAIVDVKRVLIGRPLATEEEVGERLNKKKALAIFSSDAISSSAYATDEILHVLLVAGAVGLMASINVAFAIALMLAIVSTSYRQICYAYPNGGGAYAVSKDNLGRLPALIAAASLLVDYILTVAVSTSSAVQQITSAVPSLTPIAVPIGLLAIALMTLGNLRGLRESGNIFAIPTYLFVVRGAADDRARRLPDHRARRHVTRRRPDSRRAARIEPLTIFLLLRAFAGGSVALTGTEAIANGVPAFKKPEAKNAATTLTVMALLLGSLFIGITFLATGFGIVPTDTPDRHRAGLVAGLRRRLDRLLPVPGLHCA